MESLTGLPPWLQILVSIGVLLGAGLIGARGFAGSLFSKTKGDALAIEGHDLPMQVAMPILIRVAIALEAGAAAQVDINKFLRERYDAEQRRQEIADAVEAAGLKRQKRRERTPLHT